MSEPATLAFRVLVTKDPETGSVMAARETGSELLPGPVATERWDQLIRGIAKMRGISVEEAQRRAERSIPLGRICTPEEVTNVAVFVASERASFMNGALITLDGGQRKALLE